MYTKSVVHMVATIYSCIYVRHLFFKDLTPNNFDWHLASLNSMDTILDQRWPNLPYPEQHTRRVTVCMVHMIYIHVSVGRVFFNLFDMHSDKCLINHYSKYAYAYRIGRFTEWFLFQYLTSRVMQLHEDSMLTYGTGSFLALFQSLESPVSNCQMCVRVHSQPLVTRLLSQTGFDVGYNVWLIRSDDLWGGDETLGCRNWSKLGFWTEKCPWPWW